MVSIIYTAIIRLRRENGSDGSEFYPTPEELAHAMQMPWMIEGMKRNERRARQFDLQEAIPPAFSEYVGRAARKALNI